MYLNGHEKTWPVAGDGPAGGPVTAQQCVPEVLLVDHERLFMDRMDQHYRHQYERIGQHPHMTTVDVRRSDAGGTRRLYDVLLVGVFACPLHPDYPAGRALPGVLQASRKRALMLLDIHQDTYRGGLHHLCRYINRNYPYVIAAFDCPELQFIKQRCPNVRQFYVLPQHVNTDLFRDYRLPKQWDIVYYGNDVPHWYPFRNRLRALLPRSGFTVNMIDHPGYRRFHPERCGAALARLINQAWIGIATPSMFDYLVLKYFEISACNTVIAGKMPAQGEALWKGHYVPLDEAASDDEIVRRLAEALADKAALRRHAAAMYRTMHAHYSLDDYVTRLYDIACDIHHDASVFSLGGGLSGNGQRLGEAYDQERNL